MAEAEAEMAKAKMAKAETAKAEVAEADGRSCWLKLMAGADG